MSDLLKIENLSKSFGERKVLENLTITLEKGRIYSLLGANGSGKTTLFNIISGFLKPDSGRILFDGNVVSAKNPVEIGQSGIARSFQELRIVEGLSVIDNVIMILEKRMFIIPGKKEIRQANEILEKVSLSNFAGNMGNELSYGQQKLLTIACCLANTPRLLLLDEPIAGIDDINRQKIIEIMLNLKNEGMTVFQIEHDIDYIKKTSDEILKLNQNGLQFVDKMNLTNAEV